MSTSTITIRRKSDGKILTDIINDACQTHNIYDGDERIDSRKEHEIGYDEGVGFLDWSEYEKVQSETPKASDKKTARKKAIKRHSVSDEAKTIIQEFNKIKILTQELCARLPYGVIMQIFLPTHSGEGFVEQEGELLQVDVFNHSCKVNVNGNIYNIDLRKTRPYLRPIPSMTEAEWYVLQDRKICDEAVDSMDYVPYRAVQWCNENHFDYKSLIERGMAAKAPEGMYR